MDFRKQYTKHIKENVYNFTVAGDIDQENPVNPDNAKEIQDLLRKKGVSANVSPSETKYNEVVVKSSFTKGYIKSLLDRAGILESLEEKIQPYMISYSKYGKHYGFEGGDSLSDIQNKAQKLRKKGFTIDKMGRYNPPLDKKLRTGKTDVVEGFVPFIPAHMRYMNKKKAQDAIDKVTDRSGNIRFVKHFENDTVGLVRFIYGEKELKNFDFQFPGIFYKNKRVTFHDLILKAREKVDGAKKILGLGKYKKEEKEVPVAPTEGLNEKYFSQSNIAKAIHIAKNSSGNYDGAIDYIEKKIAKGLSDHPKVKEALFKANEEKQMKEAFPKPKEDKDKKIKDLENKVQKLEVEKESELNPEPNPDTGEIPLQVGVAYKYLRDKAKGIVDKEEKKKEKKEVKVGKKTLTNKRKEKIDVEPEMEVM